MYIWRPYFFIKSVKKIFEKVCKNTVQIGHYVNFSAHLQKGEADELEALLKKHGLTHADFVRRSAEKLKNE